MNEQEIKNLIAKYNLVRRGDKVGTYNTRGIDVEEFRREVGAHKDEIIAYFDAQEEAARQEAARKRLTFESIPGVQEVRKARNEWSMYLSEFNRVMDSGDSIFPAAPAVDQKALEALEQANPDAVFALMVEKKSRSENYEISVIAKRAYDALCNGGNVADVKARYDEEIHQFTMRHTWD